MNLPDLYPKNCKLKIVLHTLDWKISWSTTIDVGFNSKPEFSSLKIIIHGIYKDGELCQKGLNHDNYLWSNSKDFKQFWKTLESQDDYLGILKIDHSMVKNAVKKWIDKCRILVEGEEEDRSGDIFVYKVKMKIPRQSSVTPKNKARKETHTPEMQKTSSEENPSDFDASINPPDWYPKKTDLKLFRRDLDWKIGWSMTIDVGFRSMPQLSSLKLTIYGTYQNGEIYQQKIFPNHYWWGDSKDFQQFCENLERENDYLAMMGMNPKVIIAEIEKESIEIPTLPKEDLSDCVTSGQLQQHDILQTSTVRDLLKELQLDENSVAVIIDGKRAELDDIIPAGAEVTILPIIGGGTTT